MAVFDLFLILTNIKLFACHFLFGEEYIKCMRFQLGVLTYSCPSFKYVVSRVGFNYN